jgi:CheY-like chemotaxis protein
MQNVSCLIIDDDQDDREFFEIALGSLNIPYLLTEAENGIVALEILKSNLHRLFDYIFLDLNMPLLNGKEFLEEVKKMPGTGNIPIIIYSTSSFYKDVEETQVLGATYFISKTTDLDKLASILLDIFQRKEMPFLLTSQ